MAVSIRQRKRSMASSLRSLLYTSRLAAGYGPTEVGRIVKQAREMNAIHGITGVLVFDGDWFAQYVEGDPNAMDVLESHLRADPRHSNFSVIEIGPAGTERRFPDWVMGYANVDFEGTGLDISALANAGEPEALQVFAAAVKTMDML